MKKAPPLTVKEKFLAVMASRKWDGKVAKGDETHLLYKQSYQYDKKDTNDPYAYGKGKYVKVERSPNDVRKMLDGRRNHALYARARKFADEVKSLKGFDSALQARRWMDEWNGYGAAWHERQILFFVDAEDLAEQLTEEEMEARMLAEML